jgi:hypothetical protein
MLVHGELLCTRDGRETSEGCCTAVMRCSVALFVRGDERCEMAGGQLLYSLLDGSAGGFRAQAVCQERRQTLDDDDGSRCVQRPEMLGAGWGRKRSEVRDVFRARGGHVFVTVSG